MNRNYSQLALTAFVILIAIVACVLPTQATQPLPTLNPNAIGTAVAGTVEAAAQQTAAVLPFSTEIPAGMTGTTIEQLQNGTTKYTDYDAGFEIIYPAAWLTVRPNSEEFNAALANEGTVNPTLNKQMTDDLAGTYAEFDRLYSYILRPDIKKNVMLGSADIEWDPADTVPLDNVSMGELVRGLESLDSLPGFRVNIAQLNENSNVQYMEVSGHFTVADEQGEPIPFYSTFIFFKPASNSTVRMSFTYLQDLQDQISPEVKSTIESIKLIEP